jgi:signal peptidase II
VTPAAGARATHAPQQHAPRGSAKQPVFWGTTAVMVAADVVSKHLAHTRLPLHLPQEVLGDVFRLTLSYNPGAAFGMSVGAASRMVFTGLTVLIVGFLWHLYRETAPHDRRRALALGLVVGGALGNLVNRLWSERGVVDFLDFGVGDTRFWTFNVADVGVSIGAILLVWVLSREHEAEGAA